MSEAGESFGPAVAANGVMQNLNASSWHRVARTAGWNAARRLWTCTWESALIRTTVVVLAILATLMALPLCTRRVPWQGFLGGDHLSFFLPLKVFYARCLVQGDSFEWMPGIYGGFFLAGEGQTGPYHPLHLLLYRWFPVDVAYDLELVLPFIAMPLGFGLFLRKYMNLAGACMGAVLITYSAQFAGTIEHPLITETLAHIPWLLLFIQKVVEAPTSRTRWWACLVLALLTASELLFGHPQMVWQSLLIEMCLAAYLLVASPRVGAFGRRSGEQNCWGRAWPPFSCLRPITICSAPIVPE